MKSTIGLLLLSIFFFSCSGSGEENVIEKSGFVEAQEITLTAKTGGTLERLFVREGDKVLKGDTLATIDSAPILLRLEKANAALSSAKAKLSLMKKGTRKEDLAQAQANFKKAKVSFELAKKEFERAKNLLKEKTIPQNKFDEIKTKFEMAAASLTQAKSLLKKAEKPFRSEEIKMAEENVKAAQAGVEILKNNLNDAVLTSPADGIVSKIYFKQGEVVQPFGTVLKVENLLQPEIKVYLPESQLGKVKPGAPVEIFSDSFKDKVYKGKVTYISPKAEFTPKTIQTKEERVKLVFEVKIVAENPDFELKSGMPVDVKIKVAGK